MVSDMHTMHTPFKLPFLAYVYRQLLFHLMPSKISTEYCFWTWISEDSFTCYVILYKCLFASGEWVMTSERVMARYHSCGHCSSNTPVVALTATATPCVKDRIVHTLQMAPVQLITKPANRPNLRFSVERCKPQCARNF